MARVLRLLLVVLCLSAWLGAEPLSAAVTARQRSAINTLKRKVRRVEDLCGQDKFDEAATALGDLQKQYDELLGAAAEEKDLIPLLEPLYMLLLRPHARLELEGVELEELKKPETAAMPAGTTSFREQVAPILVAKCGRCHVNSARGMFSMATYAALMKGAESGVVIAPGPGGGGRLIDVIESGDMPRGGLKVTPEELETLKTWIIEGAKYDAPDPETRIATFAPSGAAAAPMLDITRPTGKETVSFARDLAPVLAEKCAGCHGRAQQVAGQLNLLTFATLLRGGDSGLPLTPGQPDDSLLIGKLRGTRGERMPRGLPPLDDETIEKFAQWVTEGAAFDGFDSQADVGQVAAMDKALRASHDELSRDRVELARQKWRLGMASIEAQELSTDNFLLLGNVGEATLKQYADLAERIAPRVATLFKAPPDQPLIKGKMTLYMLAGRYDYSEFGKMIEQRGLPLSWRGHWHFSVIDAYGAMLPARGDEFSNEALLAQVIAGTYVASLGRDVPHWFAEGAARAAAARLLPKDARVEQWNEEASSALATLQEPQDFMTGKLAPEQADLAGYRFVSFLIVRDGRRFQSLLRALREGQAFEEAFLAVYRAPPARVVPLWLQYESSGGRRRP